MLCLVLTITIVTITTTWCFGKGNAAPVVATSSQDTLDSICHHSMNGDNNGAYYFHGQTADDNDDNDDDDNAPRRHNHRRRHPHQPQCSTTIDNNDDDDNASMSVNPPSSSSSSSVTIGTAPSRKKTATKTSKALAEARPSNNRMHRMKQGVSSKLRRFQNLFGLSVCMRSDATLASSGNIYQRNNRYIYVLQHDGYESNIAVYVYISSVHEPHQLSLSFRPKQQHAPSAGGLRDIKRYMDGMRVGRQLGLSQIGSVELVHCPNIIVTDENQKNSTLTRHEHYHYQQFHPLHHRRGYYHDLALIYL